jgi:hypothetical protein
MKIISVVLMVVALGIGGFLLADSIPGYVNNKELLAEHRAEAAQAEQNLAALRSSGASDYEIERSLAKAESFAGVLEAHQQGIERRRNECIIAGIGMLAVFGLGAFLFMRARRKRPSGGTLTSAHAVA